MLPAVSRKTPIVAITQKLSVGEKGMKRKRRNKTNVVIYQAKNGQIEFRVDFERNTIWGSINQIGELFGVQKAAVSKHMKNIFNDKELDKKATVSILETVQMEGTRKVNRRVEGALIERMATWVDVFQLCEMFMSQSVEEQPRVAEILNAVKGKIKTLRTLAEKHRVQKCGLMRKPLTE